MPVQSCGAFEARAILHDRKTQRPILWIERIISSLRCLTCWCSAGQQRDSNSSISSWRPAACKSWSRRRSKADHPPQQNLLPLMLRPLRLVFSAQQVRRMRIVLLKATHAPLVACILGYERALKILDRHGSGSFRVSNRLSLNSSTSLRRPLSRKTLPAERRLPFDREARETRVMLAPKQQPASESPEGLKAAIANLKTQVEILSDLLEKHKAAESP